YLFHEPGVFKIIAILFAVPVSIQLLIDINIVYTATIPFLISALIGFWGMGKTKKNLLLAYDFTTEQFDRFK
ncbi:MAG: hypothetical protein OQK32_05545, partial [Gammaproteobacteria bacterium]|nr:hypothetical protein [Gammaproteobacteria bacterium]